MGAGKLLWMPGEMLEGKVAMDKHPIKGEGGGGASSNNPSRFTLRKSG